MSLLEEFTEACTLPCLACLPQTFSRGSLDQLGKSQHRTSYKYKIESEFIAAKYNMMYNIG